MDFDLDRFKAKPPLRDLSFWLAVLTALPLLVPLVIDAWRTRTVPDAGALTVAVAPITAWLVLHGYVRGKGVRAAGEYAAAIAPEIVRHELVYGNEADPVAAERAAEGGLPDDDDHDEMPPPPGGCCALEAEPDPAADIRPREV